jgi:hypothetical protein
VAGTALPDSQQIPVRTKRPDLPRRRNNKPSPDVSGRNGEFYLSVGLPTCSTKKLHSAPTHQCLPHERKFVLHPWTISETWIIPLTKAASLGGNIR